MRRPCRSYARRLSGIALALLVLAGCATGPNQSQYVRNGVQYGVTEGTFRGRWWNYYERGRSFSDGRFWDEAEKDFRKALAGRPDDQLWTRTYGMHFLPEYFPHRELGVVLFYKDQWKEAIAELELSLGQQYSARAAYYLTRARRSQVESTAADKAAPTVDADLADAEGNDLRRELRGVARDDTFVERITVNGEPVLIETSAREVRFAHPVMLKPGETTILLAVTDIVGKTTEKEVRLASDIDGPAVSFDRPVMLPGTVTGVAYDPSGVKHLTIGGRAVSLAAKSDGTATFRADVSLAGQAGAVPFECIDGTGNVTRGVVSPNAVEVGSRNGDVVFARATSGTVDLGDGFSLFTRDGASWMLARTDTGADTQIRFANLRDGQRFFMDEVVVAVDVFSKEGAGQVSLNDEGMAAIPGRTFQTLSRRMPLKMGPNPFEVRMRLSGSDGLTESLTVHRACTPVEDRASLLNVAVAGTVWRGNSPTLENEALFIVDELAAGLDERQRFCLVDRDLFDAVVTEQELSAALSTHEGRVKLGKHIPAEIIIIGRVRRDSESIEVVLEALSAETATHVARVDVAGKADTLGELDALLNDLALRVVQEFPRVQGQVIRFSGKESSKIQRMAPRVAVVADSWTEDGAMNAHDAAAIADAIERELTVRGGATILEREALDLLITEQQLSALLAGGTVEDAGKGIYGADFVIGGRALRSDGSLTLEARLIDARTTEVVTSARVTSASTALGDLGAELARALAARFDPAAIEGQAIRVKDAIESTLTENDRVREATKCVVFRYDGDIVDPITNQVIGPKIEVLGEARMRQVGPDASVAQLVSLRGGADTVTVKQGDYVVTK